MKKNKKSVIIILILFALLSLPAIFLLHGCEETYSHEIKGEEYARLTYAPYVPSPITRKHSTKVIINLETTEVAKRLADGVEYTFWTFGGEVPGKFIRVKEGDLVEFNLHNSPSSKMPHNIDLHAVTGPGGGAASSFTAPGHTSTFSFKAINAGLYVYHCATAPVGLHVANGMYGLILVEPKEGLPPVDHEYYIMQSEFYTEGKNGETGVQSFSQEKAVNEEPEYVVFNGSVGSLTGNNAVKAKTGETIRLYIGNGGPNLVSSFHVIGEIFDKVYGEGGTIVSQKNVQTTLIPAGGSAIVEFKVDVPGTYILVDHSIFRAFNKGAIGMMQVSGESNFGIYSGKQKDQIYQGSDLEIKTSSYSVRQESNGNEKQSANSNDLKLLGQSIFKNNCVPCHQANGEGLPNVFPPLAASDYLNQSKERAISTIINGLQQPITVNGKSYNGIMPPQNLNDEQAAAVLTYVYSEWGNSGKVVTKEEVNKARSKKVAAVK
ncbi:MAG: copper-containing nitrite reductase [Ignavibacteria bacterium]